MAHPNRVPLTGRYERLERTRQIVDLRDGNVPFRTIALRLGLTEDHCRRLHARYYRRLLAGEEVTQATRRAERRAQLEALDALTMRYVAMTATPADATANGMQPRDFVAFAEASRRIKHDLIRLDGLEVARDATDHAGSSPADPDATGPAQPGQGRAVAAVLRLVAIEAPDVAAALEGVLARVAGLDELGVPGPAPLAPIYPELAALEIAGPGEANEAESEAAP